MKAVVMDTTGGPDVLRLTEIPEPEPGPGQISVDVAAAGVNFIDTYHRTGLYPIELPFVPGLEGAGTVRARGEGVDDFRPGDRVAWTRVAGSYAEVVVGEAGSFVPVPDAVPLDVAAASMLQGLTAQYLSASTYPLSDGDRCLVHAASGGVGHLLVQMAAARGAEVFATVGSAEKEDLARRAGAAHVIRYDQVDFGDAIEGIAGPRPLDVVYDGVGKPVFHRSLELLRRRGMMVTFGNAGGPVDPVSPLELMRQGSLYLTRPTLFDYVAGPAELRLRSAELFDAIGAGRLDVHIGARLPLAEAATAHRMLEGRATTGKVLLVP